MSKRNKKNKKKDTFTIRLFLFFVFLALVGLGNYATYEKPTEYFYEPIVVDRKPAQSSVEFRTTTDGIEWKYDDSNSWNLLVPLEQVQGKPGVTTFQVNGLEGLSAGLRNVVASVDSSVLGIMNTEVGGWGSAVVYQKYNTTPYTYYAITNYHVVENIAENGSVSKVNLYLDEFTVIEASVVGHDVPTDIAVVRFTTNRDLFVPNIADVNNIERGEIVIAIGSPLHFTYFNSATLGIVGGTPRYLTKSATSLSVKVIQHDAALNPGNSGGPLFNLQNELVGINFSKMSRNTLNSPSLDGLGFAISADVAAQVANQIIEFGFVRRATLGITVGDVRGNDSISLSSGIYVDSVVLGGASFGHLQVNDVIVSIDKMHAFSPAQVASYLLFKRPGDVVNISYIRNGISREVSISLGGR